jgi:hypothetical protein
MKNKLLIALAIMSMWACSAPRYTYHFDHYDYNSGKKKSAAETAAMTAQEISQSPLAIAPETMEASATPAAKPAEISAADRAAIAAKIQSLSRPEKVALKKELKSIAKKMVAVKRSMDNDKGMHAAKEMDHDLKMAAIFGAIGLVLSLFTGVNTFFWVLAVIALVIGVVFLIKWLSRQ